MTNKRDNARNAARKLTPRFFTIGDVADFFDVSDRSVRRWVKTGDLPVHRFGAAVRISDIDLRAFAARHREG
jgi:excisionase family DNA binding protein